MISYGVNINKRVLIHLYAMDVFEFVYMPPAPTHTHVDTLMHTFWENIFQKSSYTYAGLCLNLVCMYVVDEVRYVHCTTFLTIPTCMQLCVCNVVFQCGEWNNR